MIVAPFLHRAFSCTLSLLVLCASAGNVAALDDYVPGQLVCEVTHTVYIDTVNNEYGTSSVYSLTGIRSYLLSAPPGADIESLAAVISQEPYIVYCQPNWILSAPEPVQGSQPFIDFDLVGTFEGQWASDQVQLSATHEISTGEQVRVGVIDGGVSENHPLMQHGVVRGFDFVDNDTLAHDEPGGGASGHGTFVAGVIRLVAPDAEIAPYRVLDTAGRGDGFTIAKAILTAVNDGCRVINLSMVMSGTHGSVATALEYACNHNVTVIAAAGNDSTQIDRFPASALHSLSVAAVDSMYQKTPFSSYGTTVDVCAPGANVYAPFADSLYAWWDGTSFAAPFVTGLAALLQAENPYASWSDIRNAIVNTAISLDSVNTGYEGLLGGGLIDPVTALVLMAPDICGDFNEDGSGPDLSDLTAMIAYLFLGSLPPSNLLVGDVNGDDDVDLSDALYLVGFLFNGGPPPQCPSD